MFYSGYPLHRENWDNGKKIPVRENAGNLEILPKHTEFDLLKFPDSKGKMYLNICRENFQFYFKLDKSA